MSCQDRSEGKGSSDELFESHIALPVRRKSKLFCRKDEDSKDILLPVKEEMELLIGQDEDDQANLLFAKEAELPPMKENEHGVTIPLAVKKENELLISEAEDGGDLEEDEDVDLSVRRRNTGLFDSESEESYGNYDNEDYEEDNEDDDVPPALKRVKCLIGEGQDFDPDQWVWQEIDNVNEIWRYSEAPGLEESVLRRLGENPSVLNVLDEVLNAEFWESLARETNRYAEQTLQGRGYQAKKFDEKWMVTDQDEMKAYFALCIAMTQVKKSSVQSNWSKRAIIETPIYGMTMPFWRFLLLSRFLHFSDNQTLDDKDSLRKIRSVVDRLNDRFARIYTPEENLSLEESLMTYTRRVSYKRSEKVQKRARHGIKLYKLCESSTGYCVKFDIYAEEALSETNTSALASVVADLSASIANKGHTLFLSDWCTTPRLCQSLHASKINVVGTTRYNEKDIPKDLATAKLKKGEVTSRSSNGILAIKWRDKKDVYMLSTRHASPGTIEDGEGASKKGRTEDESRSKPKIVLDYDAGIGGVDLQDHYLTCFPVMRKFVKGYRKIFFYSIDMALFNAYILYSKVRKVTNIRKYHFVNFRLDVAESLLHNVKLPGYNTRGRPATADTPLRLQGRQWGHFPRHIPPTKGKRKPQRACKVCTKRKKRSETTWECKQCLVALHIPNCFELYHTVQNY